jgi:hypothetical protein
LREREGLAVPRLRLRVPALLFENPAETQELGRKQPAIVRAAALIDQVPRNAFSSIQVAGLLENLPEAVSDRARGRVLLAGLEP